MNYHDRFYSKYLLLPCKEGLCIPTHSFVIRIHYVHCSEMKCPVSENEVCHY